MEFVTGEAFLPTYIACCLEEDSVSGAINSICSRFGTKRPQMRIFVLKLSFISYFIMFAITIKSNDIQFGPYAGATRIAVSNAI